MSNLTLEQVYRFTMGSYGRREFPHELIAWRTHCGEFSPSMLMDVVKGWVLRNPDRAPTVAQIAAAARSRVKAHLEVEEIPSEAVDEPPYEPLPSDPCMRLVRHWEKHPVGRSRKAHAEAMNLLGVVHGNDKETAHRILTERGVE